MNIVPKKTIALAMALSGVSHVVLAQTAINNSSWYIAPSVNGIDPDSNYGLSSHGGGAAIRVGKSFFDNWDIQLGTSYSRANNDGVHYQQNLLGIDGLYTFNRNKVRPIILLGVGYEEDRQSSPNGGMSGYAPYIDGGVGVQYVVNDKLTIQADVRRVHGYLHDSYLGSDASNNNYFNLGFNYTFGTSGSN